MIADEGARLRRAQRQPVIGYSPLRARPLSHQSQSAGGGKKSISGLNDGSIVSADKVARSLRWRLAGSRRSVHRAPAASDQLHVYLGNRRKVVGSISFMAERQFVAQCDPKASQAFQHKPAIWIGDALNGAVVIRPL